MPKTFQPDSTTDPILAGLSESVEPIAEAVDESEEHALLVFGAKYITDEIGGEDSVQTYINCTGYFQILSAGLYSELADQVQSGNMGLFSAIREVIRDIEEDMGIEPDQEIDDGDAEIVYH